MQRKKMKMHARAGYSSNNMLNRKTIKSLIMHNANIYSVGDQGFLFVKYINPNQTIETRTALPFYLLT